MDPSSRPPIKGCSLAEAPAAAPDPVRRSLLRRGLLLVRVSVAWMLVEAGVSAAAGLAAGSILLLAFSVDSLIELVSAVVLHWRLFRELRAGDGSELLVPQVERKAATLAGILLYLLAVYVAAAAAYGFWRHEGAQASVPGLVIAVAAAFGMPVLARAKLRVAEGLESRALRADAMESLTCGYLSWVLLAGLVCNAVLGYWWLDAAASLVMVPFLLREAGEAVRGEGCPCASAGCARTE